MSSERPVKSWTAATLRIEVQRGPSSWAWTFNDSRGSVRGEVTLDARSPGDQILLERAALAQRMPGPELQAEIARELSRALGEIASALATSSAPLLYVSGARISHVALSLPFELLFKPEGEAGPVIRVLSRANRQEPYPEPANRPERIAAAFALRHEDHYLPLHAEASALTDLAFEAGIPHDELFLCFAAEDLLAITRTASVVHLAGHGREGALACYWREANARRTLVSTDLIAAWDDAPPRLVTLSFCESSSEVDALRLIEATQGGEEALQEYILRGMSPVPDHPSPSMALDLAAALPTAVLALRTAADDYQVRELGRDFYRRHLLQRDPVEKAYAEALRSHSFHDEAGLPVPTLYVSEVLLPQLRVAPPVPSSPPPPSVVPPLKRRERRRVNLFHRATAPLGKELARNWICFIAGAIGSELHAEVTTALRNAVNSLDLAQGQPREPPVEDVLEGGLYAYLTRSLDPCDDHRGGIGIDLESLPADVAIGELLVDRRSVPFSDLAWLAKLTCGVPAILDAVLEADVSKLAGQLAEEARRRPSILDRSAHRDLSEELISRLDPARRDDIVAWADAKWRAVEARGRLAIDIVASGYLLGEDAHRFELTVESLSRLSRKIGTPMAEIHAVLDDLVAAGVALPDLAAVSDGVPKFLMVDMLTASRAWAACSPDAADAYIEHLLERTMRALPDAEHIGALSSGQLAYLAEVCLAVEDRRFALLLELLAERDDGADLAAQLRVRASAEMLDRRKTENALDPWDRWDDLYRSGRWQEAEALLDEIGIGQAAHRGHPLRPAVSRLSLTDPAQGDGGLSAATALERQLLELLGDPGENDLELGYLLGVRQIKARAMNACGDADGAAAVMIDGFRQTQRHAHHPSVAVFAGASAISLLGQLGRSREARAVWESIEGSVHGLPVSAAKLFALAGELQLLSSEGRRLQSASAANALLDDLGSWQRPRADIARIAIEGCSAALLGKALGFVLLTLRQMLAGPDPDIVTLNVNRELLTEAYRGLDTDAALDAVDELAAWIPAVLKVLEVTSEALRDNTRRDLDTIAASPRVAVGELMLGTEAVATLTARANSGCLLSGILLRSVDWDSGAPPAVEGGTPEKPPDGAELKRLAQEHGSLRSALSHLLSDSFELGAPILFDAFSGDLEARSTWVGLLAGDLGKDENAHLVEAQIMLLDGDCGAAQLALRGGGPLPTLAGLSVAIEDCATDYRNDRPGASKSEGAIGNWHLLLQQCPGDRDLGVTALRAATLVFGPGLLEALGASASGTSLGERLGVEAHGPVLAHLLETLEAEPEVRGALARAALRSDDREQCAMAVDALLEALAAADPEPASLRASHAALSSGALRGERYETALWASRALVEGPTRLPDPTDRLYAHFNAFQAATLIDGPEGGAAALRQAGDDLGLSMACWVVGKSPLVDLTSKDAEATVEALCAAASHPVDPFGDDLRVVREDTLRFLEETGNWPKLQDLLRESLEDR